MNFLWKSSELFQKYLALGSVESFFLFQVWLTVHVHSVNTMVKSKTWKNQRKKFDKEVDEVEVDW